MCTATTYFVIEINAANALLRIRSRMVSSLFLLLMAVCGFLHPISSGTIGLFALALSFYFLLRTCENPRPEADTFHSHLALALGSLFWPPLLLLVIVQLWNQGVYLRSLSWRSIGAACCGILLPYFFWSAGAFVLSDFTGFQNQCAAIISPFYEHFYWKWMLEMVQTLNWEAFWPAFLPLLQDRILARQPECAALLLMVLLALTGFVHYQRKNFDDKIRVRMCHYTFLSMQVVIFLWLLFQPSHFFQLFPLMVLTTAPSSAHFIALTRTWLTNVWFVLLTLGILAVGVCCLVLPSYYLWSLPFSDLSTHLPLFHFNP